MYKVLPTLAPAAKRGAVFLASFGVFLAGAGSCAVAGRTRPRAMMTDATTIRPALLMTQISSMTTRLLTNPQRGRVYQTPRPHSIGGGVDAVCSRVTIAGSETIRR